MGGSSGGSQTSTTNTTPWSGQQPYLTDLFRAGQGQFNQGPQQYYPGNTVAPFSPQTSLGFDMTTQRALGGAPYEGAFSNYLTNTLAQPNLNPYAIANMMGSAGQPFSYGQSGNMAGFAGGAVGPYAQQWAGATGYRGLGEAQDFAGTPVASGALPASESFVENTLNDPAARAQLAATARGDYLGSNPYLDAAFNNASSRLTENFNESVLPGIAAQFGASGRTGSGAHALSAGRASGELSDSLAKLASDVYMPAYESERGRQVQAASQLGSQQLGSAQLGGDLFSRLNQAELGRLGLASDLYLGERGLGQEALAGGSQADYMRRALAGDLYTGGLDRQLAAGQGIAGLYGDIGQQQFRAGTLAPSAQAMDYANIDRLLGVGGSMEDQAQRYIDADMARWNFEQQAPWQNLANYANIIYGLPGSYGATTSTQSGQERNRLAGAAGGAMAGASLGPWGAIGGGLLGLLM